MEIENNDDIYSNLFAFEEKFCFIFDLHCSEKIVKKQNEFDGMQGH